MIGLSSCASVGPVSSDYCTLDKPILVSDGDVLTPELVKDLLEHNERYVAVCKP